MAIRNRNIFAMRRLCLGMIVLAGATNPATARNKDWQITPSSPDAVIVMRAEPRRFDYMLVFSREGQSSFGGRSGLGVKSSETAPYVARAVKPGTYKLNNLIQQKRWSTCFSSGTVEFTVQPGKVYYLGTLNIMPLLDDLQQSAAAKGKMMLRMDSSYLEWEPTVKPSFAAGTPEELAAVRAYVTSHMPMTTAPVEALAMGSTTFSSTAAKRMLEVCG